MKENKETKDKQYPASFTRFSNNEKNKERIKKLKVIR